MLFEIFFLFLACEVNKIQRFGQVPVSDQIHNDIMEL